MNREVARKGANRQRVMIRCMYVYSTYVFEYSHSDCCMYDTAPFRTPPPPPLAPLPTDLPDDPMIWSSTCGSCRRRYPGGEVGVGDGGVVEERLPRRGRGLDSHPGAGGLQRAQVLGGRPPPVRGDRQGWFVGWLVRIEMKNKLLVTTFFFVNNRERDDEINVFLALLVLRFYCLPNSVLFFTPAAPPVCHTYLPNRALGGMSIQYTMGSIMCRVLT